MEIHPLIDFRLKSGTAQGQLVFWDIALGRWVAAEINELFWDDTNKRFGIKNATPATELDVNGTITASALTVDTDTLIVDAVNHRVGIGGTPGRHLSVIGGAETTFLQITNSTVGTGAGNGLELFITTSGIGGLMNREASTLEIRAQGGALVLRSSTSDINLDSGSGLFKYQQADTTVAFFRSSLAFAQFFLGPTDAAGNQMIFANVAFSAADYDHPVQTDPTWFVHSDENPNSTNNQWGSFHHDQNNFILSSGVNIGDGGFSEEFRTRNNAIILAPRGSEMFRVESAAIGINEIAPETLLEMTSTVPYLTLHNDTEENTDGGRVSRINFKGEQDGTEETTLARIQVSHDGALDDEKGKIVFSTNTGSDGNTPTNRITIDAAGVTYIGDGTNEMQIDATGDVIFKGSSGLAYGSMYSNTDIDVTLTTQNQWYEIDSAQAWVSGKVHNCTFADPKITVTNAGTYLITYTVSSHVDANGQRIEYGIMIDSTNTDGPAHGAAGVQLEGRSSRILATLNDVGHQSGTAIIQLAAGKTISLAARNTTSTNDTLSTEHGNLTITQIAGGSA